MFFIIFFMSIGYSSISMQPHLHVSSSVIGITPMETSPSKCFFQSSRVSGSCRVFAIPSFFTPRAVFFCPVISYIPCALSSPEKTSINSFSISFVIHIVRGGRRVTRRPIDHSQVLASELSSNAAVLELPGS